MSAGSSITIHNLIAPTIDGVLGWRPRAVPDLMAIADDHDDEAGAAGGGRQR